MGQEISCLCLNAVYACLHVSIISDTQFILFAKCPKKHAGPMKLLVTIRSDVFDVCHLSVVFIFELLPGKVAEVFLT